ncbi:hypothetical protein GcC1_186006 [Golovinomyces cichoracearum]|uniref:Uncharacterized protein n=1 Tax=Golovinomyces cichoracearum TaxID=62708 RepID=A0A420HK86_9PEZI|nr:hypothetical protein GcC1_186006 [Golovinomyces cichoracearum]
MILVEYSDSESSESEQLNISESHTANPKSSKRSFQKIIDKSNPGKIKLSLPQTSTEEEDLCKHPIKKAKTLKETSSGFNSILPAPKRSIPSSAVNFEGDNSERKGIVSSVNLVTASKPGFVRLPNNTHGDKTIQDTEETSMDRSSSHSLQPKLKKDEVTFKGKTLMFKPLSVSNKTKKKKKIISGSTSTTLPAESLCTHESIAEKRPKISLFSFCTEEEEKKTSLPEEFYKPIIYGVSENTEEVSCDGDSEISHQDTAPVPTPLVSNSLTTVADNLRLSNSERRRLFGRQMGKNEVTTTTNIINFNTDVEYLHNEEVRASGEQISHNPVRAIAPGKHSLKQLVHAAQSQKDALEESFAKGKNNRAEASSKYGW